MEHLDRCICERNKKHWNRSRINTFWISRWLQIQMMILLLKGQADHYNGFMYSQSQEVWEAEEMQSVSVQLVPRPNLLAEIKMTDKSSDSSTERKIPSNNWSKSSKFIPCSGRCFLYFFSGPGLNPRSKGIFQGNYGHLKGNSNRTVLYKYATVISRF